MTAIISYDEALRQIGVLPSLHPRPNATNIRNLEVALFERLEGMPSHQSPEFGYKGMAQQDLEYALDVPGIPWVNFSNPGEHRLADGTLTADQQRDADAIHKAGRNVYDSQQCVQRAMVSAMNMAVPKQYKRTNGIGTTNYKTNQSVKEILAGLRDTYGAPTPDEKTRNEQQFAAPWLPNEPIETLVDRLEDCYVKSIVMKPPFTLNQLIDKAKSAVQRTGLYSTAMLEWNGFTPDQHTWAIFKTHFIEAYDNRIRTGGGTTGTSGYHGAANAHEGDFADDDSLASIQQSIQQSIQSMHLSNNATAQATNDTISALSAETRQLTQQLLATQQQLAMMTRGPTQGPAGWPGIPAYVQPPAVPYQQGIPPVGAYDYSGGRGGGRRGTRRTGSRRGGGRGRGGRAPGAIPATVPTGIPGAIPPPARGATAGGGGFQSNVTKWYNNWNYCYTCGYDIPGWHTSQTCPVDCRKWGHQELCTKELCAAYLAAGHRPSNAAKHKTQLPSNPHENQA